LRVATVEDAPRLLSLWASLFDDDSAFGPWRGHAEEWFERFAGDASSAWFPVVEVAGVVVAAAIGALEVGVPNPHCPRGRTVRLANVITVPGHRGRGYGTTLVLDVIRWAQLVDADRVDLSATPDGQRIYEKV